MTVVEFVRFRTRPGEQEALQAARTAAVGDLRSVRGFRAAYLVLLDHDEWLDVIVWDTPHPPADWRGRVHEYTALMTEILGEESGLLVDGSQPHG